MLRRRQFNVEMIGGRRPGRGLDDIRMLEALRSAELCVFLLPERLSDVHMALAMAHAQFVPSLRLQTSSGTSNVEASVTGTITWADPAHADRAGPTGHELQGRSRPPDRAGPELESDGSGAVLDRHDAVEAPRRQPVGCRRRPRARWITYMSTSSSSTTRSRAHERCMAARWAPGGARRRRARSAWSSTKGCAGTTSPTRSRWRRRSPATR